MLAALNFVKGAVARKDFVPALQHFRITQGFIRAFNGTIGLCSPISVDIDCAPLAEQLVKALDHCNPDKPTSLQLTDKGRLLVRNGDFKTFVDTTDPTTFPPYYPEGNRIELPNPILPALTYLEPFIAEDASRQWACGILFAGQSAFATNNIVLQEYWLGFDFPGRVNVPAAAIRELLRIGQNPIAIQLAENKLTFHFPEHRWLTTQLYESQWPDTEPLLNRESTQKPFPPNFFETLDRLLPFVDDLGRVFFHPGRLSTSNDPDTAGTTIELAGAPDKGCFNGRQLRRLAEIATTIDLEAYPEPSLFYGGQARGLIVGIRT